MGILNTIRQRPENQKKLFSLIGALIFTLFIVSFWFSIADNSVDEQVEREDKLSSISPWQVIKDEFSKVFSGSDTEVGSSSVPIDIVSIDYISGTTTATNTDANTTSETNI